MSSANDWIDSGATAPDATSHFVAGLGRAACSGQSEAVRRIAPSTTSSPVPPWFYEKLRQDLDAFGKDAHRQALDSAGRLRAALPPPLTRLAFVADAADPDAVRAALGELRPDIVITDFPYGRISGWRGRAAEGGIGTVLGSLAKAIAPGTIVAIATSKANRPCMLTTNCSNAGRSVDARSRSSVVADRAAARSALRKRGREALEGA